VADVPRSDRTARDDARARALGYESYYDYRVHGFGRIPPGGEVTPEMRRAFRGHAGLADLVQAINRPRNRPVEIAPQGTERGADGRWKTIRVGAKFQRADGSLYSLNYYLRGRSASSANLRALRDNLAAPGSRTPPPDGGIGGTLGVPPEGTGEDEGEDDPTAGSYYDYWDEAPEYDWGDYEPIPYLPANSIGEFT